MRGGAFDPTQTQQVAEQFQRMRADIKNILPIDLYEGMMRAGKLITELYRNNEDERKIIDFCVVFWTTFKFTRLKIDEALKNEIDDWFAKMTIPPRVDTDPRLPKNTYLFRGINLYNQFYDELVALGIGSMFDEPITPPIGIITDLEDESIWAGASNE